MMFIINLNKVRFGGQSVRCLILVVHYSKFGKVTLTFISANVISGICIDTFGMDIMSLLSLASLFACLTVLICYVKSMRNYASVEEVPLTLDSGKFVGYQMDDNIDPERDEGLLKKIQDNGEDKEDDKWKIHTSSCKGGLYECHAHYVGPKIAKIRGKNSAEIANEGTTIKTLLLSISSKSSGVAFLLTFFFLNTGMSVAENLVFLFYKSLRRGTYTM